MRYPLSNQHPPNLSDNKRQGNPSHGDSGGSPTKKLRYSTEPATREGIFGKIQGTAQKTLKP